ncbi:MAG: hypothetical protein LRZ84_03565 [Desertifilum sp.]|nr:hypothetical protein [Desertifilum sp.]
MFKQTSKTKQTFPQKSSFAAIFLPLSLLLLGASALATVAREVPAVNLAEDQNRSLNVAQNSLERNPLTLGNGTYLYGQSAEPDQLGNAYMVFEVQDNRVVGAFYMPHSSFDCFHGTLTAQEMALTVIDSYEQIAHPYSIALEQQFPNTADRNQPGAATFGLQGFHQISTVSANDQRMLQVCQSDFAQ